MTLGQTALEWADVEVQQRGIAIGWKNQERLPRRKVRPNYK